MKYEKIVVIVSSFLLFIFISAIIYAAAGLKIGLPTCITDIAPFKEGKVIKHTDQKYEVHYNSKMWAFDPPVVKIPKGATVDFYLTSQDVTHGFQILSTNVNLMAVPGTVNYARAVFNRTGEFDVLCHEYCGVGHQNMSAKIVVMEPDEFKNQENQTAAVNVPDGSEEKSDPDSKIDVNVILQQKACLGCHSVDGSPMVGPSFKGIMGRVEEMDDGTKVTITESHIRESIKKPGALVVKGFANVMPILEMSDKEMNAIVEYLKSLK